MQPEGLQSKLAREAELFGSLPGHLKEGLVENINELSCGQVVRAVVEGAIMGAAVGVLTRNPNALWGIGRFISEHPKLLLGTSVGADLLMRAGAPAVDVWNNPQNLEQDKQLLGYRFAAVVTDYPLMGIGGALGAASAGNIARSASSLSKGLGEALAPRSNLSFATAGEGFAQSARPTFMSSQSETALWPNRMESRMLSNAAVDRAVPNGRGRFSAAPNEAATGLKLVESPVASLEYGAGDRHCEENMTLGHSRALANTQYGKLQGKLLNDGGESLIIDTGNRRVLKLPMRWGTNLRHAR